MRSLLSVVAIFDLTFFLSVIQGPICFKSAASSINGVINMPKIKEKATKNISANPDTSDINVMTS